MLIDSDVLIWFMRGHEGAAARLLSMQPWQISTVTYLEQDLALFTANVKHFEPIHNLKLERFDPLLP